MQNLDFRSLAKVYAKASLFVVASLSWARLLLKHRSVRRVLLQH